MKKIKNKLIVCALIGLPVFSLSSCGKSLYGSFGKKQTYDSQLEDALIALDDHNYSKSTTILKSLWDSRPNDEIAQLLVVSQLANAKLDIFSIVKKALVASDSSNNLTNASNREIYKAAFSGGNNRNAGNRNNQQKNSGSTIMNNLFQVLPDNVDNDVINVLKSSAEILAAAPNRVVVQPLSCFVGGIYVGIMTNTAQTAFKNLRDTMQSNITKLGPTCSGEGADEATQNIETSLDRFNNIMAALPDLTSVAGDCLSSAGSENAIQSSLDKLYSTADTGCSVPSQNIGGFNFPTCANSTIVSGGSENSQANDKKIDGCELFVNCLGANSNCF